MNWLLGNLVSEGSYEIKLNTLCNQRDGAPEEINMFDESTLEGVINLTRSERYGEPPPP